MKLSALTLAIGILTPLYIASAQSRPATAATPPCPSGVAGPFYVYILGKGFQPSLPYNTDPNKSYAPPASTTILTLTLPPNITPDTPAMVADLTEAFANAPSFFLQQLCGLDGIFISVKDCTNFTNYICSGSLTPAQITQDSWGYREGPWQFAPGSPPGHYGRYIAISAGAWSTATSHAPTYSGYELMLLQLLLPWADTVPTYAANAAADTSAMAVLAALAHEFGHVLWYDTFRPTPGGSYDFNTFCRGTFFRNSWRSVDPPPLWRNFGDTQNEHELYDTNISDIALAITRHSINPGFAGDLLYNIYKRGGHWASLFAAFSPDEDFVETFDLYVLTQAAVTPLKSLQITITGTSTGPCPSTATCQPDIPDDLNKHFKHELKRKVDCIEKLVKPTP